MNVNEDSSGFKLIYESDITKYLSSSASSSSSTDIYSDLFIYPADYDDGVIDTFYSQYYIETIITSCTGSVTYAASNFGNHTFTINVGNIASDLAHQTFDFGTSIVSSVTKEISLSCSVPIYVISGYESVPKDTFWSRYVSDGNILTRPLTIIDDYDTDARGMLFGRIHLNKDSNGSNYACKVYTTGHVKIYAKNRFIPD